MCGFSSHQDTYPQFPRSLLGMPGTMTTIIWHGHIKKRVAFSESCSAKASLTNKHLIFSSSYQLWLIRRKAFFRHCIPHLISLNDTAIVRNFCAKKFHPWCKSKKLSKDLPPTWWRQICIGLKRPFKWSVMGKWIQNGRLLTRSSDPEEFCKCP